MTDPAKLTPASTELFASLWNDKDNWSGTPLFDGSKEERGNFTQLKRAGLVLSFNDEGWSFVTFTKAGQAFGEQMDRDAAVAKTVAAQGVVKNMTREHLALGGRRAAEARRLKRLAAIEAR